MKISTTITYRNSALNVAVIEFEIPGHVKGQCLVEWAFEEDETSSSWVKVFDDGKLAVCLRVVNWEQKFSADADLASHALIATDLRAACALALLPLI